MPDRKPLTKRQIRRAVFEKIDPHLLQAILNEEVAGIYAADLERFDGIKGAIDATLDTLTELTGTVFLEGSPSDD